jgi:asparagine synthase (glutamine-hydrolysing)
LNYIPAPHTIFTHIKKLLPGHYLLFENHQVTVQQYYTITSSNGITSSASDFEGKQKKLFDLMDDSVQMRLISDVPLGAFLSGGIDSSIVSGLAARHTDKLQTFSIGYSEDGFSMKQIMRDWLLSTSNRSYSLHIIMKRFIRITHSCFDYLDEPWRFFCITAFH